AQVASNTNGTISCFGGTTSVTISATGGTPGYTGTGSFEGVGAGSHTYTVTDANGCTSDTTVELSAPPALVASNTHGTISCFGGTDRKSIGEGEGIAGCTGRGTLKEVGAGSNA